MLQIPISAGTVVGDRWEVIRKIGEGACGVVWEVYDQKNPKFHAAMKVEPRKEDLEMLKMEALVMRNVAKKSAHVTEMYDTGCTPKFNFVVMKLLGPSISHLRKRCPKNKFTLSTSVRLAIQMVEALRDLHEAGFVHRDVKPGNFALGASNKNRQTLFILDFGLARIAKLRNEEGEKVLRPPRGYVRFRGTMRFCSVSVHRNEEPGFCDDIWSVFYTFIEMVTGELPWRGMDRSQVEECKSSIGKDVMVGCPKDTVIIYKHLRKLNYFKIPDYKLIVDTFTDMIQKAKKGASLMGPFDWEPKGAYYKHIRQRSGQIAESFEENSCEVDERVIVDTSQSQTLREVKDVASEFGDDDDEGASVVGGHSKEDSTLQDVETQKSEQF
ncbi:hypothetical protein QR680_004929 [Steinernema hermaphroditum]|uniref:Protein kinase domain-containing protein n=1 Tax=Steinernema hermaphroditum TaxID=289476 RepID=A0AA39HQA7_9BILA|nr:hypothetical protein QR680_004929 [Steinernema hermaphroditum]